MSLRKRIAVGFTALCRSSKPHHEADGRKGSALLLASPPSDGNNRQMRLGTSRPFDFPSRKQRANFPPPAPPSSSRQEGTERNASFHNATTGGGGERCGEATRRTVSPFAKTLENVGRNRDRPPLESVSILPAGDFPPPSPLPPDFFSLVAQYRRSRQVRAYLP
ncbi:hypothetical protein KM043_003905 [Ampulex compressa]|nr:hypothetical protein KM043_003905 [Ampulex compressa]